MAGVYICTYGLILIKLLLVSVKTAVISFCYVADVLLDYSTDELLLRCERLKECLLKIDDISRTLQTPRGYGI